MAEGTVRTRTYGEWAAGTFGAAVGGAVVGTLIATIVYAVTHGLSRIGFGGPEPGLSSIGVSGAVLGTVAAVVAGVVLRPRDVPVKRGPGAAGDSGLGGPRHWRDALAADLPDGPAPGPGSDAAVSHDG